MDRIIINGGKRLVGKIKASGAKNSVLPIIAASLLCPEECVLEEIPMLEDVQVICSVLNSLGATTKIGESGSIMVRGGNITSLEPPIDLVTKMRASFLVMGPLLSRFGRVRISQPGGCNIGTRPIDLHLKGFSAMGAEINLDHGCVEASCRKLVGAKIYLDFPSVGATENIMMAAVLADGLTIIQNAAEEPEIVDLATFLNKMGASITGAGTDTIRIEGVRDLKAATHQIIPDRIEAGTYMVAAVVTGGDIIIENIIMEHLRPIIAKLQEIGAKIIEGQNKIRVFTDGPIRAVDIKTLPYPGFPTDMQAQFMALLSVARGTSIVTETVFENRFMHITELMRMGASIKIEGRSAIVEGCGGLTGAKVRATDLRAGASLLLAGLAAEGCTEITDVQHIDRGYSGMVAKLQQVGADIYRTLP